MPTQEDKARHFLSLHQGPAPLLIPNPWDPGSAKVLVAMGFEVLATTSGGFAVALGLELDDALTKLPILDERLGCIDGVNESGRSLAFSGAVGAHPLGVGRPLPRPARSPL